MMNDKDYYTALLKYKSAMVQAKLMLQKGIITESEVAEIETKMHKKYGINFGSLYRENNWIYIAHDGNIPPNKEVSTICKEQ